MSLYHNDLYLRLNWIHFIVDFYRIKTISRPWTFFIQQTWQVCINLLNYRFPNCVEVFLNEIIWYDRLLTPLWSWFFHLLQHILIQDRKLKICIVIFMGTFQVIFRNRKSMVKVRGTEKWKQMMTSSCKYIDHTSYSLLTCNRCNEPDWSQFEIKYNLDITISPCRKFYECEGILCIHTFLKEYKRIDNKPKKKLGKREIILMNWCDGLYLETVMKVYEMFRQKRTVLNITKDVCMPDYSIWWYAY